MKTTLVINDTVMARLREEAARQGRTISDLVEAALSTFLAGRRAPKRLRPLPVWRGLRHPGVDVSNRDELYRVMESEDEP